MEAPAPRTPLNAVVVGLTGGIATGKSTVCAELEGAGAVVLNADHFGHEAYLPGTACLEKMVAHFGERILGEDGKVDRKTLGSIVFADPAEMQALNGIVWPAIRELLRARIFEIAAGAAGRAPDSALPVIVFEAAVMIEAKWMDLADEVWITTAPRELQRARLMARNNLAEDAADARIAAQVSDEARRAVAQVELHNDTDEAALAAQTRDALAKLRERYAGQSALERVAVVDKDDQVVDSAKRGTVRAFDLIHRCTYVVVRHAESGKVYVQRRSKQKAAGPGLLDPAPGGVVAAGESYEASARREMAEEMGLADLALQHVCAFWHEHAVDGRSWGTIFAATASAAPEALVLQEEEVESVQLMTTEEVLALAPGDCLPGGLAAFRKYVEMTGKQQ